MNRIAFSSGDLDAIINSTTKPLGSATLGSLITTLVPYIVGAAAFAVLIYIIIGGYQIMLSGGDPKSIAAGKSKVTNAIIGIIIVFFAYAISLVVAEMLGLQTITQIF